MILRKLELVDSEYMLEWMHDRDVVENLKTDFRSKTLDDALEFIKSSWENENDIHLAIASESNEYMGTVSLKNVDKESRCAEFGITIRQIAMGKGYSWYGMKNIIKYAFEELELEKIYWCVSKKNIRAVKFYDKHSFSECFDVQYEIAKLYEGVNDLKWYVACRDNKFV